MALVNSVADWVQLGLNAGALVTGGVVWKMYFENLQATIGTKEAEVSLANKQVDYWREKAGELEKRSPEAVERVLAERIAIREAEIKRLAEDREHDTQELDRVEQEVAVLHRTLEQTKGFREMLSMEHPEPDDPDYQEYLEYMESREDRVVEVEVAYLGVVGVDSGQLLITDPCYIDNQWLDEPFQDDRVYKDMETGATVKWGQDFARFNEPLEPYGKSPNDLIKAGRLVQLPPHPKPETFNYSYNGACQATLSDGYGELVYGKGHPGAGVVFQSGWGDGLYPVYGEKHDGRIMRVYVNVGAEPVPLLTQPSTGPTL
jgi:hypothetical protein